MSDLEILKTAYKNWHDCKGTKPETWLDILDDEVSIQSMGSEARPLAFAQERRSKKEALAYFAGLAEHWRMIHWSPHSFVQQGDHIAVFANCAWTHIGTGKSVETPIAHLWRMKNGKATSLIEIFDSARVVSAATP